MVVRSKWISLRKNGIFGIWICIPRDRSCFWSREWFVCGLEPQKPSSGHAPAGLSSRDTAQFPRGSQKGREWKGGNGFEFSKKGGNGGNVFWEGREYIMKIGGNGRAEMGMHFAERAGTGNYGIKMIFVRIAQHPSSTCSCSDHVTFFIQKQ